MIKNYFKTILRQLQKHKLFSFINIFGLALGMAACMVIAQYVRFHTSFDDYHQNADRIFRIESTVFKEGEEVGPSVQTPDPLAPALLSSTPTVQKAARAWPFTYANSSLVYNNSGNIENYELSEVYFGEKSGFEIFDLKFLAGSEVSFNEKYKAILPWGTASKIFDDPQEAIGKTFTLSNNTGKSDFEIIGILDELPQNSHLQFELLLSYPSAEDFNGCYDKWTCGSSVFSYVLLDDVESQKATLGFIEEVYEANTAIQGYTFDWSLRKLTDIHLNSEVGGDFGAGVDRQAITAFSLVAVIILIIAWINYMNLSLVRTVDRLQEMGVRLSMGSSKKQITGLFFMEALVMNVLAFLLALAVVQIGGKFINTVTDLPGNMLLNQQVVLLLAVLILVGTLVIGCYPSILFKSLQAVNILTGRGGLSSGSKLRKSLVFVQFMITTFLLAGTYTVYKQISFMKNADLKIETENILVLESPPGMIQSDDRDDLVKFRNLVDALNKYPEITQISSGGEVPGEPITWRTNIRKKNEDKSKAFNTRLISMARDYPSFFGIDLVAGRELREGDNPWTRGDVVINEKMAEMLGFDSPEKAVGQDLEGFYAPLTVRGVLENHHHTSLHSNFEPIAFIISGWVEFYFVKIQIPENTENKGRALTETIANIRKEWDAIFTDYPIDYFFLETHFDEQYRADERFGKLFTGFSLLAITIACLGLFGLTAFTVQQKTKEIGIRKVLGASFGNLMMLLTREYLILVGISAIITLPLAYYAMQNWLENYNFRIEIGFWFVALPLVLILILALISIGSRIANAISKNPVESLRYE